VSSFDLGYVSISHGGRDSSTVGRVIIDVDSTRSPALVKQLQSYVSLSRPRLEARVYTDDADAMRRAERSMM